MENIIHALYMVFAMLSFVIAFSVSLLLVSKLNFAAKTIVYNLNGSYFDSFSLGELISDNEDDRNRSRIVGVDSIIPTLYRYYKESFAVKILDENENLLQFFDTTTEGDVNNAKIQVERPTPPGVTISDKEKFEKGKQQALLALYDNKTNPCYLFGAPWLANIDRDAKL